MAAVVLVVHAAVLVAHARAQQVDAGRGLVDGYVAVAAWPAGEDDAQAPASPAGYTVHLVPASDPTREVARPAGAWFLPDEGRYRMWIEGSGRVSPQTVLVFGLRKATGADRGLGAVMPVAPAGTVALARRVALGPAQSVRLLGTAAGFSRRVAGEASYRGVLMPQGKVVAAVHDGPSDSYVALARPLPVRPGGTVEVAPAAPPAPLSDLLVHVTIESSVFPPEETPQLAARLSDGTEVPPEVVARDHSHLHGFWYGLDSRTVTVRIVSGTLGAEPATAALPPGGVRSLEMHCKKLPDVTVRLGLPASFPREAMRLQALRRGEVLVERPVAADEERVVLESLPAEVIEVALVSPPWKPTQEVDLRDGEDREVDFRVDAITIRGELDLCDAKQPATVRFMADNDRWAEYSTDENGAFEAVVFQPVMAYQVVPAGRTDGFVELLPMPIERDQTVDIGLACNDYRLEVRDAQTHEPVAGARVVLTNRRSDRPDSSARGFRCDEKGVLRLPWLRPGTLQARVSAAGYREAEVAEEVPRKRVSRTIDVLLTPERSVASVRVLLPSGRPAAGAPIALVSLAADAVLWEGACDANGVAEIPERLDATHVAARDAAAGFAVARWSGSAADEPLVLRLPPGRPVAVAVTSAQGLPQSAGIALWAGGVRLTGSVLTWLTQVPAMADPRGGWRAAGLPAVELGILAFRGGRNLEARLRAGELDGMWTVLRPNEPAIVALKAVE